MEDYLYGNDLVSDLDQYSKDNYIRFQMPSHKGRNKRYPELYALDINETFFSDNLNYPEDIMIKHEREAADIFKVKSTIFTVNGATAAVIASIMTSTRRGEKLLIPSNSHISCYYGALFSGCEIVRLYINDYIGGVTLEEIQTALNKDPDIKTVFITNPTFFGCSTDIKSICDYLYEHNIVCVIDESHGTHFNFSERYPKGALSCKADIVINSGHKTINGLTQCAMINLVSDRFPVEEIRFYLRMVQTTSPNYVLITSMINAIRELKNITPKLDYLYDLYNITTDRINKCNNFKVLNRQYSNSNTYDVDPMKITVRSNIETSIVVNILQKKYKILPEIVYKNCIVFMAGINSNAEDFNKLAEALLEIDSISTFNIENSSEINIAVPEMEHKIPMHIASMSDIEYIDFDNAINRISAGFISVYPPGTPVIIPGDIITKEVIEYIHSCKNVTCLNNNLCRVMKYER